MRETALRLSFDSMHEETITAAASHHLVHMGFSLWKLDAHLHDKRHICLHQQASTHSQSQRTSC
jgi:hypothetical protein